LEMTKVNGCRRVPDPPASMIPFIGQKINEL
jgi:hypothetical protein